jgi:glycosyltransferase involved in cell wall biosynthesis
VRIAIATTYTPFRQGAETRSAEALAAALAAAGHEADTVMIPLDRDGPRGPEQALAIRLLDLTESCGNRIDRLIALRAPSYALPHPDKVAWLLHPRDACEPREAPGYVSSDAAEGRGARPHPDGVFLREARKVYAVSGVAAQRLRADEGIEPAGVLPRPLPADHPFRPGEYGDAFVSVGRLGPSGRQGLAIEALRYCGSDCRLIVAGSSDAPADLDPLRDLVGRLGLEGRVELAGGVPESHRAELLATCRAALYLDGGADDGHAALEAMHSAKAIVTCRDSGACTEWIEDDFNGLVIDPEPRAIAEAMARLRGDRLTAAAMGRQAYLTPGTHGITWGRVVECLTS